MASYTTNLNLLKKDPAADASDTFNIKTMLNDNWDKIDTAVGEKVEKTAPAAAGNLATLDADGNLVDSGHLPGYFQQATDGLTAEATLDDADVIPFYDASATAHRKSTWANLKSKIKTALFGAVSGIPKLNGSGGVSTADAAALKTLLDTLASVSPATGDKIPLTDISGGAAGYSTIADILALVTPSIEKLLQVTPVSNTKQIDLSLSGIDITKYRQLIVDMDDLQQTPYGDTAYIRLNDISTSVYYLASFPDGTPSAGSGVPFSSSNNFNQDTVHAYQKAIVDLTGPAPVITTRFRYAQQGSVSSWMSGEYVGIMTLASLSPALVTSINLVIPNASTSYYWKSGSTIKVYGVRA